MPTLLFVNEKVASCVSSNSYLLWWKDSPILMSTQGHVTKWWDSIQINSFEMKNLIYFISFETELNLKLTSKPLIMWINYQNEKNTRNRNI